MYSKEKNRNIKILHLASFLGNIGDVANHQGFYKKFKKNIAINAKFSQLEIRKFYKNRAEFKFDDSFIEMVNQYDLLILGGGGFFDLKWDYSNTGTTINFSEKLMQNIKIPVLVNGMGYHEYGEVNKKNVEKFKNFLSLITKNKKWFISVRNDGSFKRMQKRYGNLVDNVLTIPDSGFFFCPREFPKYLENRNIIWVGINLTNELFNKRFNKNLDINKFNALIIQFINKTLKENDNLKIILFPHTHQDITVISIIMDKIDDKNKREKIIVAPLFVEERSVEQVFDLYRVCACVIGMRFHANVCCIGMNIPTIGLAGHEQISSLYDEIGLPNRYLKVNNYRFSQELENKLKTTLKDINKIKKDYAGINSRLAKESDLYFKKVNEFIKTNVA